MSGLTFGSCKVDIHLDPPPRTPAYFTSKDTVSGKIVVTMSKDVGVRNIVVKLEGEASTSIIREETHHHGPKRHHNNKVDVYTEKHKFLYMERPVFPPADIAKHSSSQEFTLSKGAHEYPFSFRFPSVSSCVASKSTSYPHTRSPLPPSSDELNRTAMVAYYVKCTVNRTSMLSVNARSLLNIKFTSLDRPSSSQRRLAFTRRELTIPLGTSPQINPEKLPRPDDDITGYTNISKVGTTVVTQPTFQTDLKSMSMESIVGDRVALAVDRIGRRTAFLADVVGQGVGRGEGAGTAIRNYTEKGAMKIRTSTRNGSSSSSSNSTESDDSSSADTENSAMSGVSSNGSTTSNSTTSTVTTTESGSSSSGSGRRSSMFSFKNVKEAMGINTYSGKTASFYFEMRFDPESLVTPDKPLPLTLFIVFDTSKGHPNPAAENIGPIFLSNITAFIYASTFIRAQQASTARQLKLEFYKTNTINCMIDTRGAARQRPNSPHIWDVPVPHAVLANARLPYTVCPNFQSCAISRTYNIELVAGFFSDFQAKPEYASLRTEVTVGSGILDDGISAEAGYLDQNSEYVPVYSPSATNTGTTGTPPPPPFTNHTDTSQEAGSAKPDLPPGYTEL